MKDKVLDFFNNLEMYEDINCGKNFKQEIIFSLNQFFKNTDIESARNVYDSFFKAYWVGIQHKKNPFIELTTIMREYEETAGQAIERQRDHYVHSVYVFALGLAIFDKNIKIRNIFRKYALDKANYPDSYDTKNEEFFYRWGMAALFHDIAYPLEITVKQANRYLDFIWGYPEPIATSKSVYMKIPNFNKFIKLPYLKPDKKFRKDFLLKYSNLKKDFKGDALDLLSRAIADRFNLSSLLLKRQFEAFLKDMQIKGFIDHGFYSSVIMLRWYYYLIKTTNWNPAYFYFSVVDSASAILLHNFYKRILMADPFSLSNMKIDNHPIAFLLILCDELQEWCRKCYDKQNTIRINPEGIELDIDDEKLEIAYIFKNRCSDVKEILRTKKQTILSALSLEDIFRKGIFIKEGGCCDIS